LGDFSGRANHRLLDARLSDRRPILIDRDNLDQVLASLDVEINLSLPAGEVRGIQFTELNDFHSDRVYDRVGISESLKDVRRRLHDPATFVPQPKSRAGPR
jgi:type VI secretion system protein ImpC